MQRVKSGIVQSRSRSVGVSLIELMVALTIGLLLLMGAVSVYLQGSSTYRTTDTTARLQEVARYAMDNLEPDVRLAGFWGLTNRIEYVTNRGTPAETRQAADATVAGNCGTNWSVNAASFVDGRDAQATAGPGYNLAGCAATNPVSWSDVLIVRRASSTTSALTAGRMQIQSSRTAATIFSDGVLPATFSTATSETRNLVVNAYYISEILPSPNGVRQFSLRRQTLIGGGPSIRDEEVVPGVEDMQLQFGIDTNRDGSIERYANPGDAALATARIASVRIWLLVLAEDREMGFVDNKAYAYANANFGSFSDNRRRVLISKTVQIRNSPL